MKYICMAWEMSYAEYFTMRFIHDFCDVCIVLITLIHFFLRNYMKKNIKQLGKTEESCFMTDIIISE